MKSFFCYYWTFVCFVDQAIIMGCRGGSSPYSDAGYGTSASSSPDYNLSELVRAMNLKEQSLKGEGFAFYFSNGWRLKSFFYQLFSIFICYFFTKRRGDWRILSSCLPSSHKNKRTIVIKAYNSHFKFIVLKAWIFYDLSLDILIWKNAQLFFKQLTKYLILV